jgi:hypothetical protein
MSYASHIPHTKFRKDNRERERERRREIMTEIGTSMTKDKKFTCPTPATRNRPEFAKAKEFTNPTCVTQDSSKQ